MDFGDILDAWEGQVRKKGAAKGGAGTLEAVDPLPDRQDPLAAWLKVTGIRDKDREEAEIPESPGERRRRLLYKRPDGVLDLHGLTRDDAWAQMETFFERSLQQGFEKVLVVHGKGNHSKGEPVLKRAVQEFIECCPFAGESGQAKTATGGSGAVWILLKKGGKSRGN
ncbi:MAG: Smr/MutS family protein [Spirochaetaceae bacterium]|jgi:DNA-nicking Smr family endonuclease|nr:Smr/MutS family protein [Spirochaetaceae bacterium]